MEATGEVGRRVQQLATLTNAAEPTCHTALILAGGDADYAVELILTGVVRDEDWRDTPLPHTRDGDGACSEEATKTAPETGAAAPVTRKTKAYKSTQPHAKSPSRQAAASVLSAQDAYTMVCNGGRRCCRGDNHLVGRVILAMLLHPRLGAHSVAACVAEVGLVDITSMVAKVENFKLLRALIGKVGTGSQTTKVEAVHRMIPSVDVDCTNRDGFSLVHLAVARASRVSRTAQVRLELSAIVEALVQLGGASLEVGAAENRWGFTPLMEAARHGYSSMVELLLRLGARTQTVDARGRTALEIAKTVGMHEAGFVLETAERSWQR
jgi:hypothetical protein